jgi:outer membrane immunogenic protein
MRIWAGGFVLVFLWLAAPAAAQENSRVDISAGYSYVRSNAPPGACGCFSMHGGVVSVAYNLSRHFGVVGDFDAVHAGNISGSGQGLTLTSYLFGPQFRFAATSRFSPFAHALVGGAHASGLNYGTTDGPANALGAVAGGGLDLRVNRAISVRLFEADYYFTHFENGVNSRENNLRLVFGVVFHLGKR